LKQSAERLWRSAEGDGGFEEQGAGGHGCHLQRKGVVLDAGWSIIFFCHGITTVMGCCQCSVEETLDGLDENEKNDLRQGCK